MAKTIGIAPGVVMMVVFILGDEFIVEVADVLY